jgi:hypothetical protein
MSQQQSSSSLLDLAMLLVSRDKSELMEVLKEIEELSQALLSFS